MQEFSLIETYFAKAPAGTTHPHVSLGIGDDAAILNVPAGQQLLVSTDTLVSGVHFFPEVSPADLAYKSLAVNLSDMAAMGATPAWVSLALTLPQVSEDWLARFSAGFMQLCEQYKVALIGGDTTSGPLSITVTIHGFAPSGVALRRSGAQEGDAIFVSGTLGDAAAGLDMINTSKKVYEYHGELSNNALVQRLLKPTPRVQLGEQLRGVASSCLDLSDGLVGDIRHILHASAVGAQIDVDALPCSDALLSYASPTQAKYFALTGGDDYELCFTAPLKDENTVLQIAKDSGIPIAKIGKITKSSTVLELSSNGKPYQVPKGGYEHQF